MGIANTDAPEGTTFVGAKKLCTGRVLLQMDTTQAANWLQAKPVMKMFLKNMGGIYITRMVLLNVIVEYVPTTFDPTTLGEIEAIEQNSGILMLTLISARFIKLTHLCMAGQKTAHIIFGFSN